MFNTSYFMFIKQSFNDTKNGAVPITAPFSLTIHKISEEPTYS